TPDSVAHLLQNRWPICSGIGGSFTPDYADGDQIHSSASQPDIGDVDTPDMVRSLSLHVSQQTG
ncbi:MAG: hypothetical protein JXA25_05860, partial [Anaerolineales bacterium]|nr:hypothetical protein [Anaerolineales bacterium]